MKPLTPYQKKIVRMIKKHGRIYLTVEKGIGKVKNNKK
jgi:hypothetical protein